MNTTQTSSSTSKKRFLLGIVIVCSLLGLALLETAVVYHEFQTNRAQGTFRPARTMHQDIPIQPWMTFGYINTLFNLPPQYLQTFFQIHDIRYPNIELRRYAKLNGIDQELFMEKITDAIVEYKTLDQ